MAHSFDSPLEPIQDWTSKFGLNLGCFVFFFFFLEFWFAVFIDSPFCFISFSSFKLPYSLCVYVSYTGRKLIEIERSVVGDRREEGSRN